MTTSAGPTIRGELSAASDVPQTTRDAMYALLDAHFEGVERATFDADLAGKSHALRLLDNDARLVGFSTLLAYATRDCDGRPINVICSGDTIVDPSAWHSAALPREWIAAVSAIRNAWPTRDPWLWLLLTSGFRTYRLLSTFWQSFATRGPLLDHLARERFGDAYADGIVRFARPQRLRAPLRDVPPERLRDPHVARFLALNPGHARGDELATLCSLDASNLTRVGRRVTLGPPR